MVDPGAGIALALQGHGPGGGGLESILDATQAQYDLSAWEESYGKLPAQVQDLWGHGDINSLIAGFARGEGLEAQGLLEGLWETVKATLAQGLGSLASIIGIALLTGLLDALLGEKQTNVKEIASFLCYSVCVMILSALLADQLAMTAGVIQELCGLLETVSPLLVTLLAAIGATASAAWCNPCSCSSAAPWPKWSRVCCCLGSWGQGYCISWGRWLDGNR